MLNDLDGPELTIYQNIEFLFVQIRYDKPIGKACCQCRKAPPGAAEREAAL